MCVYFGISIKSLCTQFDHIEKWVRSLVKHNLIGIWFYFEPECPFWFHYIPVFNVQRNVWQTLHRNCISIGWMIVWKKIKTIFAQITIEIECKSSSKETGFITHFVMQFFLSDISFYYFWNRFFAKLSTPKKKIESTLTTDAKKNETKQKQIQSKTKEKWFFFYFRKYFFLSGPTTHSIIIQLLLFFSINAQPMQNCN